ncbi:MAG: hypothetical protein EXR60_06585 [Dehalococcoidia bacterium]|nr:hypothetical protein [Dehalococcoidia bacterium]
MDFTLPEQAEAFRREVRAFLEQELPQGWAGLALGGIGSAEGWELHKRMAAKLAARNWIALHWPRAYGGQERSYYEQMVFKEEMGYFRAPGIDGWATNMLAPVLMLYGSEEQKREHLRPIARAERYWCQGYSEPQAGSDLASLQTRAVREGDFFVINGQKTWTTNAHHSDWIFMGVRTDPEAPKHKGITFILADLRTPGITIRPIMDLAGHHEVNEVFFDNVRVPTRNVVGEVNRGWYVMAALLDFERSGIGQIGGATRALEEIIEFGRTAKLDGRRLRDDPRLRHKLAELRVELEVARVMSYRIGWMQSNGQVPNREASENKLFSSEFTQRMYNVAMQMLGLYGQLPTKGKWSKLNGRVSDQYLVTVPVTIYAGSSEIQRNIIAQRGLGLPRG